MPLTNFGSILNFAEELETRDRDVYMVLAANPACEGHNQMFDDFVVEGKKNIRNIQRTRRENVTEMILESINDFYRQPFCETYDVTDSVSMGDALAGSKRLEERAIRYYTEAGKKIKALPEVARALKQLAKKHHARLQRLSNP